jgi:hypothetical protein
MIITADSIDDHLQTTPFPAQPNKNVSPFQCWNTSRSKLPSILEQVSMWQDRNNWTECPWVLICKQNTHDNTEKTLVWT